MVRLLTVFLILAVSSGCSAVGPVGQEAAKWHGEQALRSLQQTNGHR